jgi:cell wall-associated NlpC family hydrolase
MDDLRRFPSNGRVAHDSLIGQVEGVRFTQGTLKQINVPVADLVSESKTNLARQIMFGEDFLELEKDTETGYSYGQCVFDDYVGYVKSDDLVQKRTTTYKVTRLNAHIYPEADIKTVPLMTLPMGARLEVASETSGFGVLATGGYIPLQAIDPINFCANDMVSVAEQFMGIAYLWGGDSFQGIDCSALVQTTLYACGQDCPRDSDMQQMEVGKKLADKTPARRGDLVFWAGHVGIMMDAQILLHANAYHMCVTKEPLETVSARILQMEGKQIACHRRP